MVIVSGASSNFILGGILPMNWGIQATIGPIWERLTCHYACLRGGFQVINRIYTYTNGGSCKKSITNCEICNGNPPGDATHNINIPCSRECSAADNLEPLSAVPEIVIDFSDFPLRIDLDQLLDNPGSLTITGSEILQMTAQGELEALPASLNHITVGQSNGV